MGIVIYREKKIFKKKLVLKNQSARVAVFCLEASSKNVFPFKGQSVTVVNFLLRTIYITI